MEQENANVIQKLHIMMMEVAYFVKNVIIHANNVTEEVILIVLFVFMIQYYMDGTKDYP